MYHFFENRDTMLLRTLHTKLQLKFMQTYDLHGGLLEHKNLSFSYLHSHLMKTMPCMRNKQVLDQEI